jgi:hypothetical protein
MYMNNKLSYVNAVVLLLKNELLDCTLTNRMIGENLKLNTETAPKFLV